MDSATRMPTVQTFTSRVSVAATLAQSTSLFRLVCKVEKKDKTKILTKLFYYVDNHFWIELVFVSLEILKATNLICFTEMA